MRAAWMVLAAGALVSLSAMAEEAIPTSHHSTASKAVRLDDTDLDQITAGAFAVHFINNPGNASHLKATEHGLHVLTGRGAPGESSGSLVVETKNHLVTHTR